MVESLVLSNSSEKVPTKLDSIKFVVTTIENEIARVAGTIQGKLPLHEGSLLDSLKEYLDTDDITLPPGMGQLDGEAWKYSMKNDTGNGCFENIRLTLMLDGRLIARTSSYGSQIVKYYTVGTFPDSDGTLVHSWTKKINDGPIEKIIDEFQIHVTPIAGREPLFAIYDKNGHTTDATNAENVLNLDTEKESEF